MSCLLPGQVYHVNINTQQQSQSQQQPPQQQQQQQQPQQQQQQQPASSLAQSHVGNQLGSSLWQPGSLTPRMYSSYHTSCLVALSLVLPGFLGVSHALCLATSRTLPTQYLTAG